MKKIRVICLGLIAILLMSNGVLAGGFNVQSIGSVETGGRQISKWWYTGLQPTIKGEGLPGSTVNITIDDQAYTADVTSDSEWTFTVPAALAEGDHSVVLVNSGSTIKFNLALGSANVDWDAVSSEASVSTLPTVGVAWPTWILPVVGLGLLGFSAKIGINARK